MPNASVNSSCAQLPFPSPLATVGHLQILHCPGAGHLPTLGPFSSFWQACSSLAIRIIKVHRRFYWKKNRLGHLSRTGINWRGWKRHALDFMPAFLPAFLLLAYQARITQRNQELSMWINVFRLLNQISVDINIWRSTSYHVHKTIHNI